MTDMEVDQPASVRKDDLEKLWGFLMYGTPRCFHIPKDHELSRDCAVIIDRLINRGLGQSVIKAIREAAGCSEHMSDGEEHVPASCLKYPLLYALAVCIKSSKPDIVKEAYRCITEVCGIPSHLFLFLNLYYRMCEREGPEGVVRYKPAWSRGMRRAVGDWYTKKFSALRLAELVTKYRNRYGWNHKRVLKVGHIKPPADDYGFVFYYILFGFEKAKLKYPGGGGVGEVREYLKKVEIARDFNIRKVDEKEIGQLLEAINLGELKWQHLNTYMLKSPLLMRPIITMMPPIAMIRNLGRISLLKHLDPSSQVEEIVCQRLRSEDALLCAKVHPFIILTALSQYEAGINRIGRRRWPVNENVVRALWDAFHLTFGAIRATRKRILIGINANTTMQCPVVGSPAVSSKLAAAALAKLLHDVEAKAENPYVYGIQFTSGFLELNLMVNGVKEVYEQLKGMPITGTDCGIPFGCAKENNLPVDAFIIFTDLLHSNDADKLLRELQDYQRQSGLQRAKLVIVSLSNSDFTIAHDDNVINVHGVDIRSLQKIRNFISDAQNELSESLSKMGLEIR